MSDAVFILFSIFTIGAALGVVFSRSPIYSAFGLILSFFGLSVLYVLWSATFIAMIQILIYTGAIVVLFVFVVMLLNLDKSANASPSWLTVATAGGAVWLFALLILRILNHSTFISTNAGKALDMKSISRMLFNEYLWPFEVLSVFLLALIVAIYALTRPEKAERS